MQQLIPESLIRLIFDYYLSGSAIKFNTVCDYNTLYDPLGIITGQGGLFSWGCNQVGQLGFGIMNRRGCLAPKRMTYFDSLQVSEILSITSTLSHQFFVVRSSKTGNLEVYATGLNTWGQLGIRPTRHPNKPKPLPFFNEIKELSHIEIVAQLNHTFFVVTRTNGIIEVYATGCNNLGQLGLGNHQNQSMPAQITFFNRLKHIRHIQIIAQVRHTFFMVTFTQGNIEVYATGYNRYDQLGLGNYQDPNLPTQLTFLNEVGNIRHIEIVAQLNHTFFVVTLTQGGLKVYGAGYNCHDQLGLGNHQNLNTPTQITFFNHLDKISHLRITAQENHTFFVVTFAQGLIDVYAVGHNNHGQIGRINNRYFDKPTKLTFFQEQGIENIRHIEIAAQPNHTFFVLTLANGAIKVYTVGCNSHHQLGVGNFQFLNNLPLQPTFFNRAERALHDSHKLHDPLDSKYPLLSKLTQVTFFKEIENIRHIEIATQPKHTLFIVTFAHRAIKVYGVGHNNYGQLGLGSAQPIRKPTEIRFLQNRIRRLLKDTTTRISLSVMKQNP